MVYPAFVCSSFYVSICLLVRSCISYSSDFYEFFLPQMCLWTGKNWLNFESHSLLDPDIWEFTNVWRIQHCEMGYFPQIWLISLYKLTASKWIFLSYIRCIFRQGSPNQILEVTWIRNANPNQIHLGGGLRFPSSLVAYEKWVSF